MCLQWATAKVQVSEVMCEGYAAMVQEYVLEKGYRTQRPFTCSNLDTTTNLPETLPFVVACGDFRSEADARGFGQALQDGGFEDLANIIGSSDVLVPINGELACAVSTLSYVITDMTKVECDAASWQNGACAAPQDEFPYHDKCTAGALATSPYSVTYARKFAKDGNNYYCFKISVDSDQCSGDCCSMELDKIEWMSNLQKCRYAVDGWTVSTKPNAYRQPTWQDEMDNVLGGTVWVLKTNELGLTRSTANGAEVCIALRSGSSCPTMEDFCFGGVCKYAVYDKVGEGSTCCAQDYAPGLPWGTGYARR